jgi:hypothetical protein
LQRIPNLRFIVKDVYQGIDTIVIAYRNQDGGLVSEVLRFSGDLVIEGHGTSQTGQGRKRNRSPRIDPSPKPLLQGAAPQ